MGVDSFIKDITSKFLRHLGSIDRLGESYKLTEKENLKTEKDVGEFISYVLYLKHNEHKAEQQENWEELKHINERMSEIEDTNLYKLVDKNLIIHSIDEGIEFSLKSGLLRRAYEDYQSSTLDLEYDDSQFQNSLVISLVIGLEMLVGEIFKDFIINLDKSEQLLKDKQIDYKVLMEIGDVEEAKVYLIDKYIEKQLRRSFNDWLDEFEKSCDLKIRKIPELSDIIKLITETTQRRHLIIHNDGKVNDLFINKIDKDLKKDFEKGEILTSDQTYIKSRISTFRTFGLILIYLYGLKRHRNEMEEFFMEFHGLLVLYLEDDFAAPRYIFSQLAKNKKLNKELQGICYINYYLTYKLNNDDSIDEEIENFPAEDFDEQIVFAKSILLNGENAVEEAIKLLKDMDNDDFLNALTWPLLKLVKPNDVFKAYARERLDEIYSSEMEVELIENT